MSFSPFRPAWWIPGPHGQTLWGKFFRRDETLPTKRERWDTPDGDFLDIWRLSTRDEGDMTVPRVVLLHGLEGSIRSHYVNGIMREASRRGWAADLIIFRSCGEELNRARRFYHSGETSDLSFVIDRLASTNPYQPIALVGVSLGGNVLLKYLGEHNGKLPKCIFAAAAVSVPFDLGRGSKYISNGFSKVYEKHFLKSLKQKVQDKAVQFPDLIGSASWRNANTLYDFDDCITAPVHGFVNAEDYYNRSSSINYLDSIRVSTLLLNSRDDPFLPAEVLTEVETIAERNAFLELEFTSRGGHVGFVGGSNPFSPVYYLEERIGSFFDEQLEQSTIREPLH